MAETQDDELRAIDAMLNALSPLDDAARQRALDYVLKRLEIALPLSAGGSAVTRAATPTVSADDPAAPTPTPSAVDLMDIRTLREQKQPKSATEMAAIVAYYLAELAPPEERKEAITTADLEKYFKQAGHRLPTAPQYTLSNASSAGYFDSAGRGLYKLNPVGHNLVAHSLPASSRGGSTDTKPRARRRPQAKTTTKPTAKKVAKSGARAATRKSGTGAKRA